MARIFIFGIYLLFSIISVRAQYSVRYNTDNGLPSNHVYQIEQDADGFMWFGTNMGIVKFDGKVFKTFTTREGLPSNDIWRLEATDDGKIFFFSKSKKQGYIYRDSVFSFLVDNIAQQPRNIIIEKNTVGFMGDSEGKFNIYRYNNSKWEAPVSIDKKRYSDMQLEMSLILPNSTYILFSLNAEILLKDLRNGNLIYKFKSDSLSPRLLKNHLKDGQFIHKLYNYSYSSLYFMTDPYLTSVINLKDSTFLVRELFHEKYTPEELMVAYPEIQSHGKDKYQISRANEWISVDEKFKVYDRKSFDLNGLSVHVFKDKQGNFWSASHEHGITSVSKYALSNKLYFKNKKIQALNYENGVFFVNVFNEGWYTLDLKSGKTKLIFENKGKSYDMGFHEKFNTYYFYSTNGLWYGRDLNNIKKISQSKIYLLDYGWKSVMSSAKTMIETPNGYKSIGSTYLLEFDSAFQTITSPKNPVDRWMINGSKIMLYFKNKIYIGGEGIYTLTDAGYKQINNIHPLLQLPINTMIDFDGKYLLIGTNGFGAYFYDGVDKISFIKGTEGYTINKFALENENIWMATGKGVHKFSRNNNDKYDYHFSESIYDEDGLLDNNVNSIFYINNKLFAAQDNGLIEINLEKKKYTRTVAPYYNEGAFYDRKTNTYTTSYGNNISLSFGVLSLPSQKYIRYYYKTDNDDQWIPTNVTTLTMGKQLPGNYVISFKAVDQHGNVGKTSINLVVLPLWYQTTLAKIIGIVFLLIIVILITIFFRKRVENKRKAELLLNKTLSELELKALRSQMNPHFIFNSLNAIQYYIVKNKSRQSEEYLAKFARLVRLFFEYSKYDSLTISQEVDLLSRYLEIEKLRFEDKLDYTIEIDEAIDADDVDVPSMILQPIVENAVNHGIFHKKGKGHVSIIFKQIDPHSILVSVIDDGVGISAMKEIQKDNHKNYKSNSSEVVKERLKILSENKLSKWSVTYKIVDKNAENLNETGTLVEILIVYNQ